MMDGTKMSISNAEAEAIMRGIGANGGEKKWIAVGGAFVNSASISGIYPDEVARLEATIGRLHDGTKVVRQFGRWVDAGNPEALLDHKYYPEAVNDAVVTEGEWQQIARIANPTERRQRTPARRF
jgi:hypothetical protein